MGKLEKLLDTIFPSGCIYCGRLSDDKIHGFCPKCYNSLSIYLRKSEFTWYIFDYDKKIAQVLKKAKYGNKPLAVKKTAGLLGELLLDEGINADLVTCVPMYPKEAGERGYNQSRIAAARIAGILDIKFREKALIKTRKTRKQAELNKNSRKKNLKGAFWAESDIVSGKRVLLVDDITTTGSTLEECRAKLLEAGALSVEAAVIARTPCNRKK